MNTRGLLRGVAFGVLAIFLAYGGSELKVWQSADHLVFRFLYLTKTPEPNRGIRLIDITDYPEREGDDETRRFRETLGSALNQLAALPAPLPKVLIDIWLSNNRVGEKAVTAGIEALRAKGADVFATVKLDACPNDADFLKCHNEAVYFSALTDYGHTDFDEAYRMLKYEEEKRVDVPEGGFARLIPALVVRAADRGDNVGSRKIPIGSDTSRNAASHVIPIGSDDTPFASLRHTLTGAAARIDPPLPAHDPPHFVIIGSFAADRKNPLNRAGPLLLAWAMSDRLAATSVARQPLNHPAALLGLSALSALLGIGAFWLSFRTLRGRIEPSRWTAAARWVAAAAFLTATLIVLGVGAIMLLVDFVIPVAFPVTCAALGSGFGWLGARRWIANEQVRRELAEGGEERAVQYDVFVSYAHDPSENQQWVKSNIVEPLAALRHADGTPFRIFFDEQSIKVGRQWKKEIELALLGTRCFLPVYSERYFERPYCREEIEMADQLRIEDRLHMFPVARSVTIPERYLRKVQYIDARTDPKFIDQLIERIALTGTPTGSDGK